MPKRGRLPPRAGSVPCVCGGASLLLVCSRPAAASEPRWKALSESRSLALPRPVVADAGCPQDDLPGCGEEPGALQQRSDIIHR